MIVPPGLSRPARSAASIIGRPIRSLTEPPGLSISSLARSSGWRSAGPRSRVRRVSRTSGVLPTRSRIDSAYCIGREYTAAGQDVGVRCRQPVPVEAAGPEQQPRQPRAAAAARWSGGSTVRGWSASTAGPRIASKRSVSACASSSSSRMPRLGSGASRASAERARGPTSAAGRARPSGGRGRAPPSRPSRAARPARRCAARSSAAPGPERAEAARRARDRRPRASGRTRRRCRPRPAPRPRAGRRRPRRARPAAARRAGGSAARASATVNVDGALPRNQARGSSGSACIATNGSIQPRWAAATSR